jgi:PPM family protein phosphatase
MAASSGAAYVAVTALSHDGLIREHNEDSVVVGPWTLCATVTENPQTLLFPVGTPLVVAVADGLGGHPGGEVASAIVVRELALAGPGLSDAAAVTTAVRDCNRAVHDAAAGRPELSAMGTTVAGLVLTSDEVIVFNVGDSRVYTHGADGLRQVSVDDSPPLAPGQRSTVIVTQTLGGQPDLAPVDPHVRGLPLDQGVRFLICTDGLSDVVDGETLESLLREHGDGRAAYELWKAAIAGGGPDNITLALVRLDRQ